MNASFVDTNVLVYAYDQDEPAKQALAKNLLRELARDGVLVLSTQVLQEFFVTVTRKLTRPLPQDDAIMALRAWSQVPLVQIDPPLILEAANTSRSVKLSFWDALILEAAVARRCERVLSEDLQSGFSFKGLRVENPFP